MEKELEKRVAELERRIPVQPIEYSLESLRNQLFQYVITTVETSRPERKQNIEILPDLIDRILRIDSLVR